MIDKAVDKVTDKLPSLDQYKKDTKSAVSYVFMLVFFLYFIYNEFVKKDDCGSRVTTLETVIKDKDNMIQLLNKRVDRLEIALDTRNGVINRVKSTADSISSGIGGAK